MHTIYEILSLSGQGFGFIFFVTQIIIIVFSVVLDALREYIAVLYSNPEIGTSLCFIKILYGDFRDSF